MNESENTKEYEKTVLSKGPVFDLGLCRCCGTLKKCRLLNTEYLSYGKKEVYSDLMMDCFGLLLSHLDGKLTERLICATCVVRLREAFVFKVQVLKCEEAFIQMKMYEGDKNAKQEKEEFELKVEKEDRISDQESAQDQSVDHYDLDLHSDDDMPLTSIAKKMGKVVKVKTKLPSKKKVKIKPPKKILKNKIKTEDCKNKSSMPALQQLNRERDLNYIIECNLLTLVECSYICPFKCRHSNLLCYYCGKLCEDGQKLREHNALHDPKKLKIFDHKKTLKVDISVVNCRLCEAQINNIEDLKQHLKTEHKKKIYNNADQLLPFKLNDLSCVLCSEKFLYFHALNKHMNVHYSNYVCETCGLGFVDKCRLSVHLQRHEESLFPCDKCSKVFKAQYNRDLHVDRVHNKKGRVFCPKCDVMLMSYPQKLKHLVEVHGEEPLSFTCDLCGKVCRTRRMLTIHRRKDHLNDFRYECQFCGQRFFTRFSLNNHTPTHTGERNFKCKVCEKSYPRLKTLKDHMRIHTNDRRYRCAICGQGFIQNCSLKGHMKSQHPEYG